MILRWRRFPRILATFLKWWAYSEIAYYAYFKVQLSSVQRFKAGPEISSAERQKLREKILEALSLSHDGDLPGGLKKFFSGWFHGAPFESLKRQNIVEHLAHHEFAGIYRELPKEKQEEIMQAVEMLEDEGFKMKLPEGINRDVKLMCPALESVQAWYRPLVLYVLIYFMKQSERGILWLKGFKVFNSGGIKYLYRPSKKTKSESKDPIVFFHGIAPGLSFYLGFLFKLLKGNDRDIFLVELPWVGMRAYVDIPTPVELVRCVDMMLHKHGVENACFIGHSYGSIVCAWTIKLCPRLVKSLVLLDPVCVLLCFPDVAANFLHMRSVHTRKQRLSYFKLLFLLMFFYISSREIGIAETLTRNLWWQYSNLFFDDLTLVPTSIILSSRDSIVPAKTVYKYIFSQLKRNMNEQKSTVLLKMQEGMPHGGFLMAARAQREILDVIESRH